LPIVLLGGAAMVEAMLGGPSGAPTGPTSTPSWSSTVLTVGAFAAVLAVLWIQALAEEIAWRGYLLPRLMEALGSWPGVLLHGFLWGICYAPIFLVGDRSGGGALRIASFTVTCALLGVVLGWLRLASGSIAASATVNATLTICAGLPLVLRGFPSLLGSVFTPAGWIPMALVIAVIAARPALRAMVITPARPLPDYLN
jgi:membrane protease YdiL (CAAX protease family)